NLLHAMGLSREQAGRWPVLNVPGISVTVGEMLGALERVGGVEARALVTDEPDQRVMDIVCSWPGDFEVERLVELGFVRDETFDAVVEAYRGRERGPVVPPRPGELREAPGALEGDLPAHVRADGRGRGRLPPSPLPSSAAARSNGGPASVPRGGGVPDHRRWSTVRRWGEPCADPCPSSPLRRRS
ncbi:hypothetical protein RJJ65_36365, partial [Rhizobium hidalgonense]|nr:hypothetical protein [Rhizobium hidalgonense]